MMPGSSGHAGKVIETMDAGSYTYVHVDTGEEKIWAAAPQVAVKVGDEVVIYTGMPMSNFHSATLNRTFDLVYFVPSLGIAGTEGESAHPPLGADDGPRKGKAAEVDLSGIQKADGGKTIEELFSDRESVAGQEVAVRGKVVKSAIGIMGKNWFHIRDGTGAAGSNDLTVTSDATAQVGDTLLVRGIVATDKDFGSGYKYELIVEDAEITVE
jgi:hypothetical protein